MARSRARIRTTTSLASLALLASAGGCRRPSADLQLPDDGRPTPAPGQAQAKADCPAVPKPPPGSADDREPPTILGARFVARDRVQLTFSEALAPVAAVNPRQFRLSHAYTVIDAGGDQNYATGYYYDLAGADLYEPPLVVVALELYADRPEVLALSLSRPVTIDLCEMLAGAADDLAQSAADPELGRRGEVGLFLHYTQRGSEGVRDRVQNPLQDIGADWALNFGTRHKTVYGTEPVTRFDLLIPLECPGPELTGTGAPPGPI